MISFKSFVVVFLKLFNLIKTNEIFSCIKNMTLVLVNCETLYWSSKASEVKMGCCTR